VRRTRGPSVTGSKPANSREFGVVVFAFAEATLGPHEQAESGLDRLDGAERFARARPENEVGGIAGTARAEPVVQRQRRVYHGRPDAPRLFTGARRNPLPVHAALFGALAVELHDAVVREHRRYAGDAKFGCLLHHEVHAFAARDALYEVDLKFGLRRVFDGLMQQQRHAVLAEPADRGGPLAIVAVENVHGIVGSGRELFGNMESFQCHDRCVFIASALTANVCTEDYRQSTRSWQPMKQSFTVDADTGLIEPARQCLRARRARNPDWSSCTESACRPVASAVRRSSSYSATVWTGMRIRILQRYVASRYPLTCS
jgi:hypothetical protein